MRTKQNMVIEQTYEYAKKNMRKEDPQSQKVLGQLQEGKEHDDQELQNQGFENPQNIGSRIPITYDETKKRVSNEGRKQEK